MLRSTKDTLGYRITATDGPLGEVDDFYFDDFAWAIRYVVVDTGGWLPGRQVLISPQAVGEPDWAAQFLPVSLTRQQIEDSPSIAADLPVSRQQEVSLARHFRWAPYWGAPFGHGVAVPAPAVAEMEPEETEQPTGDPNLRSVSEVIGYRIQATDGRIGHVEDLVMDTKEWLLRYLIVDTRNWLPGRKVLISPAWVHRFDWSDKSAHLDLTTDEVKGSPEFDPSVPINREYEARLYDFYGRPTYWE